MKYPGAIVAGGILVASAAVGCWQERDWGGHGDNEIVFGISQKTTDGKVTTSVGYEFLELLDHGWSTRGVVTPERRCWAERLDRRLGQPRVAGGVATFEGGTLPPGGLAVVANRGDDLTLDAPAWSSAAEPLTFQSKGFAMPDIRPVRLDPPSAELTVVAPVDASAEVVAGRDQELEVAWITGDANANDNVVASLTAVPEEDPGARGVELRCFFDRSAGRGSFPSSLMKRFASLAGAGTVKGTLSVATHRQRTIFADGGWTVYVVATVQQREQPFVLHP